MRKLKIKDRSDDGYIINQGALITDIVEMMANILDVDIEEAYITEDELEYVYDSMFEAEADAIHRIIRERKRDE